MFHLFLKYCFHIFSHIFNVQADPEAPAEEEAAPSRRRRTPAPATGRGRRLGRGGRLARGAPVSTFSSLFN